MMYYIPHIPPEVLTAQVTLDKDTSKRDAHEILGTIRSLKGVFQAAVLDDECHPHEILITYSISGSRDSSKTIREIKGVSALKPINKLT